MGSGRPSTHGAATNDQEGPWRSGRVRAYPLGATFDGSGTNFAVFSEVAEQVELCLFDDDRARPGSR